MVLAEVIYYLILLLKSSGVKIMIVGITPGLQQMLQSFQVINDGKSLKEVKDLSSFKGSMRTTLIKYFDELKVNKKLKIKSCESLFNKNSKHLHTTSLVKYPVFDKGKNYAKIISKKIFKQRNRKASQKATLKRTLEIIKSLI